MYKIAFVTVFLAITISLTCATPIPEASEAIDKDIASSFSEVEPSTLMDSEAAGSELIRDKKSFDLEDIAMAAESGYAPVVQPGYGHAPASYGSNSYSAPAPAYSGGHGYSAPAPAYSGGHAYSAPAPSYSAGHGSYGSPSYGSTGYAAPAHGSYSAPSYGGSSSHAAYGGPAPSYGSSGAYGAAHGPAYGAAHPAGYAAPSKGGYGSPAPASYGGSGYREAAEAAEDKKEEPNNEKDKQRSAYKSYGRPSYAAPSYGAPSYSPSYAPAYGPSCGSNVLVGCHPSVAHSPCSPTNLYSAYGAPSYGAPSYGAPAYGPSGAYSEPVPVYAYVQ